MLHVQAHKIRKIASGAQKRGAREIKIMQFSRHAREIVASQISVRGAPKINARLKFMHSYICVLKIMRAMWTRQDAKGVHVAQFSRAPFTATAIMQIYFRSVINWPITISSRTNLRSGRAKFLVNFDLGRAFCKLSSLASSDQDKLNFSI